VVRSGCGYVEGSHDRQTDLVLLKGDLDANLARDGFVPDGMEPGKKKKKGWMSGDVKEEGERRT